MIFPNVLLTLFLLSCMTVMVSGHDDILKEVFLPSLEESFQKDIVHRDRNHHLRSRQLQTDNVCQANNPGTVIICGTPGGSLDQCDDSTAQCSSLADYPCTCTASAETSCKYCHVRTSNSIVCLVSGSSMTFVSRAGGIETCECSYLGNGQIDQKCSAPTEAPITPPGSIFPFTSPTQPPVYSPPLPLPTVPAVVPTMAPVLTTMVPIATMAPVVAPTVAPVLPTNAPIATMAPVVAPTTPPVLPTTPPVIDGMPQGCVAHSDHDFNIFLCLENGTPDFCSNQQVSCAASNVNDYACTCNGQETVCNYCQVQTNKGILCQVVGNSITFVDPAAADGSMKRCDCRAYGIDGRVQQVCYNPVTPVTNAVSMIGNAAEALDLGGLLGGEDLP